MADICATASEADAVYTKLTMRVIIGSDRRFQALQRSSLLYIMQMFLLHNGQCSLGD